MAATLTPSTQLVDIATAPQKAEELAKFVAAHSATPEAAFRKAIDDGDFQAVANLALDNLTAVFSKATDDDIQGFFFAIIFSFYQSLTEAASGELVTRIASLVSAATDKPALRLRILADVYNLEPSPATKLPLFIRLVRFASATKQLEVVAPYFRHAATWQDRCPGLPLAQIRELYLLIAQALATSGGAAAAGGSGSSSVCSEDASQAFLIRYLATFEGEAEAAVPEEAKAHAVTAALGYVRAPVLSQRSSLPHLTAVRALKGDARHTKLHELLTIFASGDLEAYLAFHAANGAWVASQGVDHDASTETMRLLTLCTLAAGKPTLPFAAVAAALKVEAAEVEGWVVRGITRGLLDARIDQAAGSVIVTRTLQREFTPAHWGQLATKLRQWRDSVAALVSTMETGAAGTGHRGGAAAGAATA